MSPDERARLLWQAIAAACFVAWLLTFSFGYFRSQLLESQYLATIRGDVIGAVQQLNQQQQALAQRLQALEARGER